MSGLGRGRGGRGQALLEALQQPVRKPGSAGSSVDAPPRDGQSQLSSTTSPSSQVQPSSFPLGRGLRSKPAATSPSHPDTPTSSVESRLPAVESDQPSSQPQPSSSRRPVGRGLRGLSLLQELQSESSGPPVSPRVGAHSPPKVDTPEPATADAPAPTTPRGGGRGLGTSDSGRVVKDLPAPTVGKDLSTAVKGLTLAGPQVPTTTDKDPAAKKGTKGRKVLLNANYLSLQGQSQGVYQYAVSYSPMIESKNDRFRLLFEHSEMLGKARAFDGAILYLPKKITDSKMVLSSTRRSDDMAVTVTVALVSMVQYAQCMQLFNTIFRKVLRALDLIEVGRNYYDPHSPIAIPQHKMELWPGYVSAIQQHDGGLLLLFDVSHRLLRTDTALDFMYEMYSQNSSRFQDEVTKVLVGVVVLTRYNNKTYRIDDIAWDKNPMCTFQDDRGNTISFVDYYKNTYSRDIQDREQPLLIHRSKRRGRGDEGQSVEEVICLVPELCSMTGLTDKARQDYKVMKDIAAYTRVAPNQREGSFRNFVDRVHKCDKARGELESWGLQLDPSMIQLEGRQLPPENIMFRSSTQTAGLEADWGKYATKENVITAVPLNNWVVLATKRDSSKAYEYVEMMKKVCPSLGIKLSDPKLVSLPNDRTDTYIQSLRQEIHHKLQLVVAIFPTSRDDRYAAFKKFCCVESPVPSQVINARTISQQQKLRSVTQKIALQINCKLGGELWAVEIPVKNMMVIGMDVYHDGSKGQKQSILGFVASTNQYLTRWYSRVDIQGVRQEIADSLKVCLKAALENYAEVNGCLPDRIVVYRDGVGDGQMHVVREYEIPQMTSCFASFADSYNPKLAVVVVQKRISTRIFLRGGPKGLGNPAPGSLVDHTITRKGWYDFFLISQHVRQGTVTPTHYCVVHDTSGFTPDHIQRLSYKLTHMYYNWPGTIRVPAPCQYAHKLAFLVGQSLHKRPALELSDRLFFL